MVDKDTKDTIELLASLAVLLESTAKGIRFLIAKLKKKKPPTNP